MPFAIEALASFELAMVFFVVVVVSLLVVVVSLLDWPVVVVSLDCLVAFFFTKCNINI